MQPKVTIKVWDTAVGSLGEFVSTPQLRDWGGVLGFRVSTLNPKPLLGTWNLERLIFWE